MNQSPLTSVFTRMRDRLHRIAFSIVGSDEEAEDILQDAFCRLWAGHPDIQTEIDAAKLSFTAVRNRAIDSYRKNLALSNVDIAEVSDSDIAEDHAVMERRDVYEAVIRLSEKVLNERQAEVFRLHDINGLPYEEVALELGMTQENVRMTLSRARKVIREVYRKNSNENYGR